MRYYFDTSALCRYYHSEPGSPQVEAIVNEAGATLFLSWLTVLETQSAFAHKVRSREIIASDFILLRKRFKADIARRQFLVTRILRRHFDRAENLIASYGLTKRLRSLDALHLGAALDLQQRGQLDYFITADAIMDSVAQQEELAVKNPTTT